MHILFLAIVCFRGVEADNHKFRALFYTDRAMEHVSSVRAERRRGIIR